MILLAAAAAAAALPFAPPPGRPLRYAIEERRPRAGASPLVARTTETALFARDGDGWLLTVTLADLAVDGDGDGAARARIEAAVRPWLGVPVRLRLSAGGEPIAAADAPGDWARLLAGLRAAGEAAVADRLAATPSADRAAQLLHAADDIVAARLPALAVGETVGTITRVAPVRFTVRRARATPQGTLAVAETIDLAPDTGLVAARTRTTTLAGETLAETRIVALP